jgi:hypothetical protein
MRSNRITTRNRANAQKSTGPRTSQGKAIVSTNARRHGATSKPKPTSVAAWARIILDKPDLDANDILKDDMRISGALALAEAEVRLCSARAALDRFDRGKEPQSDMLADLQDTAAFITDELEMGDTTAIERRSGLALLGRIQKMVIADTQHGGKRHKLLQRYVREARGHRKRAFQTWLVCLDQTSVSAGEFA